MSLKAITVLRRARKLIADPKRWIKKAFKKNRNGVECYCGLGAIAIASGIKIKNAKHLSDEKRPDEYYEALALMNKQAGVYFFTKYNDRSDVTHAEVLAVFDRAIAAAKVAKVAKVAKDA